MTGPKKGSRGRTPKRNTAQGRGGITRDSTRPVRERTPRREEGRSGQPDSAPQKREEARSSTARPGRTTNPARRGPGEGERGGTGERTFKPGPARQAPPKLAKKKPLPELKRVQLDAPPADTVFRDRDGERLTFPDSSLKRVAAHILTQKNKAWRYRAFSFPLFTEKGNEQSFYFDFYIYDAEDSVIRLLLVVPSESREVWDRVGRFKRQYPMYTYELWTPEKLAQLQGPRGRLGF
ncbi:hypothetical protein Dcar01_02100 [Deinococcus carri]|uniref:Uncharacterized protein n=1 Tax=Deinococcus carri TaxID=1211323 RepID=A0ABP9WAZ9_9DEIO